MVVEKNYNLCRKKKKKKETIDLDEMSLDFQGHQCSKTSRLGSGMFGCCSSVPLHLSTVTNTFCLLDANCVKSQLEISAHSATQFSRESNSYPESSAAFLPHHTLSKELGFQLNFWPFL